MKLFHTSDLHLGRRRLDGRLPDQDLANAFGFIADQAVAAKADAFLIAGDLFDRPQVEPPHLRQAQQVLARLKTAGIPVLAIEGNHDKSGIHTEEPTWVHYLAEDGLLVLLRTAFDASGPLLAPWDAIAKRGSWLDLGGVRFLGAGYLGAATPHKLREIAARLDPAFPHVLLLHAGPEYFVGEAGGFSSDDLRAIHSRIRYLALGHIHKPMLHGGWACNPGSPENCDLREAASELGKDGQPRPRGYAVVEFDPAAPGADVAIQILSNPRRPCHRLVLDCTPFGNKLKDGTGALIQAAIDLIQTRRPSPDSIIDLRLTGRLNLKRIAFDQLAVSAQLEQAAGVFAVAIESSDINLEHVPAADAASGALLSREEVEQAAIRDQFATCHNLPPGLDTHTDEAVRLFFELKQSVHTGRSSEELAALIAGSPLVESIRAARQAASTAPASSNGEEKPC